ncbi:MAG TPA: hypothetical protein VN633_07770, partial [Bryobacteraceae bacterium]|nr:hypothetical protein [Bryobacteraceae bacterium]
MAWDAGLYHTPCHTTLHRKFLPNIFCITPESALPRDITSHMTSVDYNFLRQPSQGPRANS